MGRRLIYGGILGVAVTLAMGVALPSATSAQQGATPPCGEWPPVPCAAEGDDQPSAPPLRPENECTPSLTLGRTAAELTGYVIGAAGGRGRYWYTFLGVLIGVATIVGPLFTVGLLPGITGMIAYELSQEPNPECLRPEGWATVVMPTVEISPDDRRWTVGLAVAF